MQDTAGAVTEYYDRNTKKFLRFGHGGADLSIHRAVWGPGVTDRSGAMHFVDERITETTEKNRAGTIVDLGCGCGGSLVYMKRRYPAAEYYGITISQVQKECGDRIVRSLRVPVSLYTGSYLDREFYKEIGLPRMEKGLPSLFFAVESFIHCPDPDQFFKVLKEAACPGDHLIICDDFIVQSPKTERHARYVREFTAGWRAANLMDEEAALLLAEKHSFHHKEQYDFTPMLELNRFRDRVIRLLIPIVRSFGPKRPYLGNLLGGNALQRLLAEGILKYKFLILERAGP